MSYGDEGAFLATASCQPSVLGSQVAILCVARRPSRLHESPFQPAVAWGDASFSSLPSAFFIARTHSRPGCHLLMRRKWIYIRSHFCQHHLRYTAINTTHGVETLNLGPERARNLPDLGLPFCNQRLLLVPPFPYQSPTTPPLLYRLASPG